MKIWLFYRLYKDLEPQLYAYTCKKNYAEDFNNFRKNFYMKVSQINKSEFKALYSAHPDEMIDYHRFKTRTEGFGLSELSDPFICTNREIKQIILYKNNLALRLLGAKACSIKFDIFSENIKSALNIFGYENIIEYMHWINFDFSNYSTDSFDTIVSGFEVDELGLFIIMHLDTIQDTKINHE